MIYQLRWINAGTIAKEVELRDIHVISRFITTAVIISPHNRSSQIKYLEEAQSGVSGGIAP